MEKKNKRRKRLVWGALLFLMVFAASFATEGTVREAQAAATGFKKSGGKIYYYQNGKLYKKGWLKLNGKYYYMDKKTGAAITGWYRNKDGARYFDTKTGVLYRGWNKSRDGYRYFYKGTGIMATGWTKNSEGQRYFAPKTGLMKTGWVKDKSGYRYFSKTNGVMITGIAKNREGYRYFNPKTGIMVTGLHRVKANTYRFYDKKNGVMWTGLKKYGGYYYYLDPRTGYRFQEGSKTIKNKLYYFDSSGRSLAGVSASSSKWSGFMKQYQKDSRTNQLIFVQYTGGSRARVLMYTKSKGSWKKLVDCNGYVGSGGINKVREGDRKTPTGTFSFTKAFGIKPNPGSRIPYTRLNKYLYWCGDQKYYNTLVDIRKQKHNCSGEHLISYVPTYHYALALNYNPKGIYNKGSAIFLHCTGYYPYTGGCISVSEANMVKIMKNAEAGAKIFIYPK